MQGIASCCVCSASEDAKMLKKCPICFRFICEECSYRTFGRWFCNRNCAEFFFFGGDDDD
jgi:hypothetical protein